MSAGTWKPPATEPAENGWEQYESSPTITSENADGIRPGTGSPEAAVAHFYASRIRGDQAWEEVLPEEGDRSDMLLRKLQRMADWRYASMALVARKPKSQQRFYVRVALEVEAAGKLKTAQNEVTVQLIDERWLVMRPPT